MVRQIYNINRFLIMKKSILLFLAIIPALALGQLNNPQARWVTENFFPDPDIDIQTPAFQKKKGYTKYKDLILFLEDILSKHPETARLEYIGQSQKGKTIPMLVLERKGTSDNKIRVWIQGGLHGDEGGSTEAVLYMISQILENPAYDHLLDRLIVGLVPTANIDGFEKQVRQAANGLDLNRDQTKLMAPETVVLKTAFRDFDPHVALDFHEFRPYRRDFTRLSTWGITTWHDVMFLFSGNLNVPENLRRFTDELFVENARRTLSDNGLRFRNYITTRDHYGDIHFAEGSNNARSSATSWALANTVSALIEVRGVGIGRHSFKRRVFSAFLVGMSFLQTSFDHPGEIIRQLEEATKSKQKAVVTSAPAVYTDTIRAIDLDTREVLPLPVTIRNALLSKPMLTRDRPLAYIIDGGQAELVGKLNILGLETELLTLPCSVTVQAYRVSDYFRSGVPYEGVRRQEVMTELITLQKTFESEHYVLRMDQPGANLAIELLEPEAPNSFVSFSVLPVKKGAELPVYRLTESLSSIKTTKKRSK
jgi:hypothetical protein